MYREQNHLLYNPSRDLQLAVEQFTPVTLSEKLVRRVAQNQFYHASFLTNPLPIAAALSVLITPSEFFLRASIAFSLPVKPKWLNI